MCFKNPKYLGLSWVLITFPSCPVKAHPEIGNHSLAKCSPCGIFPVIMYSPIKFSHHLDERCSYADTIHINIIMISIKEIIFHFPLSQYEWIVQIYTYFWDFDLFSSFGTKSFYHAFATSAWKEVTLSMSTWAWQQYPEVEAVYTC